MSDGQSKRKQGPGDSQGGPFKKSKLHMLTIGLKGGKGGRWKTPFEKAKAEQKIEMGKTLEVGDEGLWVTFARGMRSKAMREFTELCEQYGKEMYGIVPTSEEADANHEGEGEGEEQDIEASIEQELNSMKTSQRPKARRTFTPIPTSVDCLFFLKTTKPVDPSALVRKICEDARDCPDPMERRSKYINRVTPVLDMEKATESGIERVVRSVLAPWFRLKSGTESEDGGEKPTQSAAETSDGAPASTYAIRHNIRNHNTFKSGEVIKMVADLVDPQHKVNLTNPDKVILVEIYQFFCGISVVDAKEWEALRKYNVNELYKLEGKEPEKTEQKEARPTDKADAA